MGVRYYPWAEGPVRWINRIYPLVGLAALTVLIVQFGFFISSELRVACIRVELGVVVYYVVQYLVKFALAESRIAFVNTHWFETLLIALILLETALVTHVPGGAVLLRVFPSLDVTALTTIYVAVAQIVILLSLVPPFIRYNQRLSGMRFHPAQIAMAGFVVADAVGALLLMLPRAVAPGRGISWIDALFTSTSALCVTGLTVVDTGTTFSHLGQLIILGLIQVGGIGIITIAAFLALFFNKGISLREYVVVKDYTNADRLGAITTTVRNIFLSVLSIEFVGALLLVIAWRGEGWSVGKLMYFAVFHSVSAFCNAGFALFSDNLMSYSGDALVVLTVAGLITLGGLGFGVLADLVTLRRGLRMRLHTRLVLRTSLFLFLVGFFSYVFLEPPSVGAGREFLSALFTSVTARTAGYNTVDTGLLSVPFSFVIVVLMFIGASPASTGGGIKTTTAAVLAVSIGNIIIGNRRMVLFRKNIPFFVLNRALIVLAVSMTVVGLGVFLLTITEPGKEFLDLLFETVSAFGTVGLSRNLTPLLSDPGRLIVIGIMLIGRIGILTLAFAITAPREQRHRVEYPTEQVLVG